MFLLLKLLDETKSSRLATANAQINPVVLQKVASERVECTYLPAAQTT